MIASIFLFLLAVGIPIAFVLGISSVIYLWKAQMPYVLVSQRIFVGLDNFLILAVPLFILAGKLMNASGITRRLIEFFYIIIGHIRGGVGLCEHHCQRFLCRYYRCRGSGHGGDWIDHDPCNEKRGLFAGIQRCGHGDILNHRANHSAEYCHGCLWCHGRSFYRKTFSGWFYSGPSIGICAVAGCRSFRQTSEFSGKAKNFIRTHRHRRFLQYDFGNHDADNFAWWNSQRYIYAYRGGRCCRILCINRWFFYLS